MTDNESPVLASVRNRVGHLTLNRPAGLNALTLQMVRIMWHQLQAWESEPEVLAVVLRASGEKAFCAGGDIRALYDSYQTGDDKHHIFLEEKYALDQYIHGYSKPTVALMDGFVLGGGMGLVQGTALRVVTERVKMGMPETSIGYFPDVGGSYFLPRLPGELGLYLGITGVQIRAADALYARLADWCLPSEQIPEFDRRLDQVSWAHPPREILAGLLSSLASNRLLGAELKALHPAINEHFAQPELAAILASLQAENRAEYQDWAEQTVELLNNRSPLAISATLKLLRLGRTLSLANCFELELHLERQWFAKGDLMEGVRALLIDKDKTPRWNPPTLEQLDASRVNEFFDGFQPAQA
ncbi:TPA: enoyl-CoA hydratase/isomerase family protein [Pseudomonas aeruginosa]|uniref:enoyl-CoA hydratase/isomerase family protein n=1 Tax=Pseudomonas aeruginosa TaxID=287 RepID=UPI00193DCF00|nr:enoyl-CoA hydratase/isomerase family protein [Pseudomonas aeruginosa]MBI8222844.1 enoyl-CoA hydratase/isomerase family protein [Pseudomonas aeruginosa]MDP5708032.1 enoyl-CoA hydratase/isomerase family protein [Pseudomonas aeruginosa]HBO0349214.1 enoyl-CoA hydratase/isomerase family protein [Pseudomonas aeruginosa]HCF2190293.1 enoyl-CoA hydratase/isomerase family protein [Pseudomonas aeruginosa]HCW0993867.1 enoyl-CoA hydratase/isomerase family protein [Pseudomonas aeruginosa]